MNRSRLLISTPILTAALMLLGQAPLLAQEGESTDADNAGSEPVTNTVPADASTDAPADTSGPAVAEGPPDASADTTGPTAAEAPTDVLADSAGPTAAEAPTDAPAGASAAAPAAASAVTLAALHEMLKNQQSQLDGQKRKLAEQHQLISSLQSQATTELVAEKDTVAKQAQQIEQQRQAMASMQTQIDQISQKKADEMTEEELALRSRLETLESSIQASQDAASTTFDEDSFPNSTMIPGTNAAMRMGGFVKMNIVETFDPLGSFDRFIAGTIPVPQQSSTPRTTMTVGQSRLNWDLRDKTQLGTMRAYIEGDFAGDGDTFRLRHAFGQFKDVLAGKTWSVFQDTEANPEELDFEGINGQVNVRQPQIRYFPKIGQDWNLTFSVEDPNPEVTGGLATSRWPDLVASAQRTWFDRWHIKSSVVLRQLTAIWAEDPTGDTESQELGWGFSVSGKAATRHWNASGSDNLMFQLNFGRGIGRYINDLNTIGGEDAIFDDNGDLNTLPVFAGYVAYQHWWRENARSTMNLSWVNVDNYSFEPDDAYHRTFRGALNYIWSPTPRIDLGMEYIYGNRENKNEDKAHASQIQLSTKYRF